MKELINRIDMFPTPVWRYRFTEFEKHKKELIDFFTQDKLYFIDREQNGLQTTDGNLHRIDVPLSVEALKKAFKECFEDVMIRMGYEKNIGITSMWATRQRQGGYHHQHIHRNCFLAGVLYLFDNDGEAEGTRFINSNNNLYQINPPVLKGEQEFLKAQYQIPFVPGTFAIFPGWANHLAPPTNSSYRVIIGCNSMPVGKANTDHYDQYEFPNPDSMIYYPLDEHLKNGYNKF